MYCFSLPNLYSYIAFKNLEVLKKKKENLIC